MSASGNIWVHLTRVVVFLLAIAFFIAVGIWYSPVIKQNEQMRKERLELDRRIARETELSKQLETSIRSLQDPRTVERMARERLSYAKPGETVIHFEAPAEVRQ